MDLVEPRLCLEPEHSTDTPRERTLRKQLHDVQTRLANQRNHYETVLEQMLKAPVTQEVMASELAAAHRGIHRLRADIEALKNQHAAQVAQ